MAENDIKTIVFDRIRHTLASMKMAASNAEVFIFSTISFIYHYLFTIIKSIRYPPLLQIQDIY